MDKDRTEICKIISHMLDNPGECEIYPTSTAYDSLEDYVEQERMMALGYAHAWCCNNLDNGEDPRTIEVPKLIEEYRRDGR